MSGNAPISLILTNEQLLCASDNKRLLGKWCVDYSGSLDAIRKAETLVLPYPFDEPGALPAAYAYLQRVDQRLFPAFAERLNKYHHLHKSQRYWRIIAGYWWREFMEIAYERYVCVTRAASMYPDAAVKVIPAKQWVTPYDSHDFGILYKTDTYNHQLYSQLIEYGHFFHAEGLSDAERQTLNMSAMPPLRTGWIIRVKDIMCRLSKWNRQYFASTYLLKRPLCRIAMTLKCFPTLDTPRMLVSMDRTVERYKRASFSTLEGSDAFEQTLIKLLPVNIPKCYLEDFTVLSQKVSKRFPRRPMKSIVTANAFAYNDGFKIFTAEQAEQYHTPFVILQHGGQYGCAAWHSSEDYEKEIADRYLTYGWRETGNEKVIPFIVNRFSQPKDRPRGKADGDLLWVMASFPRYSYAMYSVPVGPQFVDYLNDQAVFMSALPGNVCNRLKARLYRHAYGWHDKTYIEKVSGLPVMLSNLNLSLAQEGERSRLVICTYNATSHLETLALNIPTLIYWNARHWPLRPEAEAGHRLLREAGILFHDPISAAAQVAAIYPDVSAWWKQPAVQEARKLFCQQFAVTGQAYTQEWLRAFQSDCVRGR